jgi:hypothetical protein
MVITVTLVWLVVGSCSSDAMESGTSALVATPGGTTYSPSDFVGSKYASIFIEIDAIGKQAAAGSLDGFISEINELISGGFIHKTDGIRLEIDQQFEDTRGADRPYSFEEIKGLVSQYRTIDADSTAAGLYLLYVDGTYETDTEELYTLGFAYGGSVIVIFRDNVRRATDRKLAGAPIAAIRATETSLLIHEFGHILGLVNNGTPMVNNHQDKEHGAHDTDEDCVMFWQADGPSIADTIATQFGLGKQDALKFGDSCLADLKAAAR